MRALITIKAALIAVIAGVVGNVEAIQIQPATYTFIPYTSEGSYDYRDETGTQLTDGVFGMPHINSAAEALPYVGWRARSVKIDFTFDEVATFDSLVVSALQTTLGNIALPDIRVWSSLDGVTWSAIDYLATQPDVANNWTKAALLVDNLNVTTKYLQVQLIRHDAWIFSDEISFFGSIPETAESSLRLATAVPESGSTMVLIGIGIIALAGVRRSLT
jgi:hypothetical protein